MYVYCVESFAHIMCYSDCSRRGLYEVPLSVSLLGFGIANFHVRNASPREPICFRCLIFSLSGPCDLLFLLCFIASWT